MRQDDEVIERLLTPFQKVSDVSVRVGLPRFSKHEWDKLLAVEPLPRQCKGPSGLETHYTPEELGAAWHLSANTIRRLFEGESGVVFIDRPEKMHKRGYCTMRIPQSVAERVRIKFQSK